MKVAASHLDNRAETAVIGAAARSLHDVYLATEQTIPAEDASSTLGQANVAILQSMRLGKRVMDPSFSCTMRKATDTCVPFPAFYGTQKVTKGNLAFPSNHVIHSHFFVGFRGKTRVITSDDDFHGGLERTRQINDATSGPALKGHH